MPPVIEAHFFAPDDVNGDTIFECSTDDPFVKGIKLDIQRDKLGSGQITFARRVPTTPGLFTPQVVQPEVFVRYLIPSIDATHYLWGNFIGPRQQKVISKAESGGEGFVFGGPGPKFYLTRMILWSASFSGQDNAVDRDAGLWTWPETAKLGRIFGRLLEEEQDNPHGPFLPDLTKSFGDVNDSNGDPWVDDVAGTEDFTLNIQDDYLKILWALENESDLVSNMNLGTVSNPLMQLGLYQSFGRDLTGDPGDPDAVHFIEGQRIVQGPGNIASDLDVEGESLKKGTHALVRGADGIYHFVASPDFVPGEYKKVVPVDYSSSANTNTLDRAGKRYLRRQRGQERGIRLKIVPGVTPEDGLYVPGFDGTNGHFWLSDTVSLTTGIDPNQTELDYDAEDQLVTGIQIELAKAVRSDDATTAARSLVVTVELNQDRQSDATTPEKQGSSSAGSSNCNCIRLCAVAHEGTDVHTRLYYSQDGASFSPAIDAAWDQNDAATVRKLKATPDSTNGLTHQDVNSLAGTVGGSDICMGRFLYGPIDADLAAAIAAGGIVIRGQRRTYMRSGAGISESSQHGVSQQGLRVTVGASTTIRGTALALHTLALGSGAAEWEAVSNDNVKKNRVDPPGPANDVLSAVAGTVAGDYLLWEIGVRNYTSGTSTGAKHALTNAAASDLPEDETTATALNSWLDLFEAGSGAIEGDVPQEVVRHGEGTPGTSGRASRCDHEHGHGLLSSDGEHYHSREDIEGNTDLAIDELNDVDTTGVSDGQVLKWDSTEGLWLPADDDAGVTDLDDLSDVNISSPSSGQVLAYSGSQWTNSSAGVPAGVVGPILIQDTPAGSPLVFADLLQNDDGDDLLYADI